MNADDFPLGGVTESLLVPPGLAGVVVLKLTSCEHSHAFVVDRSGMGGPGVRFGLSESGLRCAMDALDGIPIEGVRPGPRPEGWHGPGPEYAASARKKKES